MVNGFSPATLKEALEIRARQQVIPYAGGTDLMLNPNPDAVYLFVNQIAEMKRIVQKDELLHLGAACTYTQLLEHPLTPAILKEAIALIAAPAIRNEGTIGGNIANGSAKADSVLIFFVADASIRLSSLSGERVIPIKAFYQDRKRLDLHDDELITEIILPTQWLEHYYYKKVGARKALAISRVDFAGLMTVKDGRIKHCATAFGAISGVILRRPDLDELLIGQTLAEASRLKAAYLASYAEVIAPIKGRVSAEYRKEVCLNLLEDFLNSNGIR
ncbi:MAG: FAD binding domain-containing protein [Oscillospiraceae bacterium]|nr:FAD binding domain-containing protein [Oscillospiraceae bacterium]MDD4368255.1 FAD binding domain-containing protein [Oscillospiraceae bacterium]